MKYPIALFGLALILLNGPGWGQTSRDRFNDDVAGTRAVMLISLVNTPPYVDAASELNESAIVGHCDYDSLDFSAVSPDPYTSITGKLTVLQQLAGTPAPKMSRLAFELKMYNYGTGDLLTQYNLTARKRIYDFYGRVDVAHMSSEPQVCAILDDYWLKQILEHPINKETLGGLVATFHSDDDVLKAIGNTGSNVYEAAAIFRECLIADKVASPNTSEKVIDIESRSGTNFLRNCPALRGCSDPESRN